MLLQNWIMMIAKGHSVFEIHRIWENSLRFWEK